MADGDAPAHLDASALGTKEYWDDAYTTELHNHASNPSDEGIIWFSDSGAEDKIVDFLQSLPMCEECQGDGNVDGGLGVRILDLGTGNGHLLFALQDEGWGGADMVGVDYSDVSVEFARRIQKRRREEDEQDEKKSSLEEVVEEREGEKQDESRRGLREVMFERFDILEDEATEAAWVGEGFDIVLDKGTFDAISLNHDIDSQGRKGFERYGGKVERLMKPGGYLLVTSCNWTEAEVRKWFESDGLEYHGKIRYHSFTFGGVKGQTLSSVCFRRKT